jgi:hypothetical protein
VQLIKLHLPIRTLSRVALVIEIVVGDELGEVFPVVLVPLEELKTKVGVIGAFDGWVTTFDTTLSVFFSVFALFEAATCVGDNISPVGVTWYFANA